MKTKKIACNCSQKYKIEGITYLLCGFQWSGDDYAVLIDNKTGNRYTEPIRVSDFRHLTTEEFEKISVKATIEAV